MKERKRFLRDLMIRKEDIGDSQVEFSKYTAHKISKKSLSNQ